MATLVFRHHGIADGLPGAAATVLVQDDLGFLWVGTQGGLARWDGHRYRTYTPSARPGALRDGFINVLRLDRRKRLWIGTSAGGLMRYARDSDTFVSVPALAEIGVRSLDDDETGGLWVGTEKGLYHLDQDARVLASFGGQGEDSQGLPGRRILSVLHDATGSLWVGTDKGFVTRGPGQDRFAPVSLPVEDGNSAVRVTCLYKDRRDRIWIGTQSEGLFVLEPGENRPHRIDTGARPSGTLRGEWVHAITESATGDIWAGTFGGGLYVIDARETLVANHRHVSDIPGSLGNPSVWSLLVDRSGTMWVGHDEGLDRLNPNQDAVLSIYSSPSRGHGPAVPDITGIQAMPNGTVWLGHRNAGVEILDPGTGAIRRILPDPHTPDTALPTAGVDIFASGRHGAAYIGTLKGLYCTLDEGRTVKLLKIPGLSPFATVKSLLVHGELLWVGTDSELVAIDEACRAPAEVRHVVGRDQLADLRVFSLQAVDDDLLIGTGNGLNRLDLSNGRIDRLLDHGFITALTVDETGRLWVGTFGDGVQVAADWKTGKPRVSQIGTAQGLHNDGVNALLLDRAGVVWASTDGGIDRIDPATLAVYRSSEFSSFPVYWASAGTTTPDGHLLFGGQGGITAVLPEGPIGQRAAPPVVFTDGAIGGKDLDMTRYSGAADSLLVIRPEANAFTVGFALLDFLTPEQCRYSYQLDGFDRDWLEAPINRRYASYTNLPPGEYRLRVRVHDQFGAWPDREIALPVKVLPAWWQTLLFRLLFAALIVSSLFLLFKARTAQLRRRQIELEQQVELRTAELRQREVELEIANASLLALATSDPLTGCLNRRGFLEKCEQHLALRRRTGTPLVLLLLDIDHFKRINDTHGHPAGDAVLKSVADALRRRLRESDILSRIGGEEFAVLLPDTTMEAALALAEQLRSCVEGLATPGTGLILRVTASFGVAEVRGAEPFTSVYSRADAALYRAKNGGRNQVAAEEPE